MLERNQGIIPLRDNILLKRMELLEQEKKVGSLILPSVGQEEKKTRLAKVISIGDGGIFGIHQMNGNVNGALGGYETQLEIDMNFPKHIDIKIEIGDIVMINEYSGIPVSKNGEDYILSQYGDVMAIWEKAENVDESLFKN